MLLNRWSYGFSADPFTLRDRQLLLLFTVLGEGRARLVYAKRSVAPLSTVKHNGFGTFVSDCLLVAPGHLGTGLPPDSFQIASQLLPDCLQVAHLTLIGVSRCSHENHEFGQKLTQDRVFSGLTGSTYIVPP